MSAAGNRDGLMGFRNLIEQSIQVRASLGCGLRRHVRIVREYVRRVKFLNR
jgi:hypothetical protein